MLDEILRKVHSRRVKVVYTEKGSDTLRNNLSIVIKFLLGIRLNEKNFVHRTTSFCDPILLFLFLKSQYILKFKVEVITSLYISLSVERFDIKSIYILPPFSLRRPSNVSNHH